MTADKQKIAEEVIALERSFNERFSIGDSSGYLDNFHQDISYFDPVGDRLVIGQAEVIAHLSRLYKNPHIVRSEYLNSHVIVSDSGDLVILSYNLNTFVLDETGREKLLRAWNATEVYKRDGNGVSLIRTGRSRDRSWTLLHHSLYDSSPKRPVHAIGPNR